HGAPDHGQQRPAVLLAHAEARAAVVGRERERAHALEQPERHPAAPGHAPAGLEAGDLDGERAPPAGLGVDLDRLAGGDRALDLLDARIPVGVAARVGEDLPDRVGTGVDRGAGLVGLHAGNRNISATVAPWPWAPFPETPSTRSATRTAAPSSSCSRAATARCRSSPTRCRSAVPPCRATCACSRT